MTLENLRMLLVQACETLQALQPAVTEGLYSKGWDDDVLAEAQAAADDCPRLIDDLMLANRTVFLSGNTVRTTTPILKLGEHQRAWQLLSQLADLIGKED
jgi:hypothetical protein